MKNDLRKTKIICTIGPASEFILEDMINTGMNVTRVNFSHGGKEEQAEKVERIKATREKMGIPVALLLDTQGPEIRLGKLTDEFDNGFEVEEGYELSIVNDDRLGDNKVVSISYKELYNDVKVGSYILIDDGSVQLEVVEIDGQTIKTVAKNKGTIKGRKSVNVPGVELKLPALKEKDINDLLYGIEADFDYIAASFTRNKEDIIAIRNLLKENGGERIKIIAKIENQEAIEKIDEIIEYADGIMIARGDLAVEVPFTMVPLYQKEIIRKTNKAGKPVIVATQMLDSMINNPLPTRAEANDVANAVYDRATAIMLSGEAAVGKYPLKCVDAMNTISRNVETEKDYYEEMKLYKEEYKTLDEKTAYVAARISRHIDADAVIAYTKTGASIPRLAATGIEGKVFVVTEDKKVFNQLALIWNVYPILVEGKDSIDEMIEEAIVRLKEKELLKEGNTVYITGGTDFIKNASSSKRAGGIAII